MKLGAYDFVQKPFNLNEVLALAEKSLEKNELKRVIQELRESKKETGTCAAAVDSGGETGGDRPTRGRRRARTE